MSKLFIAVLALSTASLVVGYPLGLFLSKQKTMLHSDTADKGAFPGDDTNYEDLRKAYAAIKQPITVAKVKEVLKEHAPKLYLRVEAAEKAFDTVRGSVKNVEVKGLLTQGFELLEQSYLAVSTVQEQASQRERLRKLVDALGDEAKKEFDDKQKEVAEAITKAFN